MAISNEPEGFYVPEPFQTFTDVGRLSLYLSQELLRISSAFNAAMARRVECLNAAPDKPFDGQIVCADGTNWNPGSGQGIYAYYNNTWNKL